MQDVKGLLKPSCFLNLILQEKPGYSAVLTVLKSSREAALAWLPGLRRIPTSTLVSPRFAFPGWLSREHTSAPLSHTPGGSAARCFYLFTLFTAGLRSLLGVRVCCEQGAASHFLPPALPHARPRRSPEAPPRPQQGFGG